MRLSYVLNVRKDLLDKGKSESANPYSHIECLPQNFEVTLNYENDVRHMFENEFLPKNEKAIKK